MQTSQKQYVDRQRRDHSVAVGDQVLLDTRNLNLSHLPSKIRPRFCGPFLVEAQVTPVTFRLRLPDTWKLHNAFHVQLLKPYKDPIQQFQGRQLPPPPPVLVQDEPEYEVERVLTNRRRGGKTLDFLLRWKGYNPTEDSWVVEADMGNARRALKDYLLDPRSSQQRSSQGYTFSPGLGSVSWRSTRSSSVLRSSCDAEIYAGGVAAQELRWLTYLLTDLGEQPRSRPVLCIDNKAMIALCQEHRLEHKTKHIALRYFLARELQKCGQLRLAYVATRANTAYIFTKVLQPRDHERFFTVLGLVPTLPHLLTT
ncbi:unnamed protein product [Closterium sp. NIES-53]